MSYIYGRNPVEEYLKTGQEVFNIYVQKGNIKGSLNRILENLDCKEKIKYVDKNVLDKLSENANHQGILIEVNDFRYSSLEDILSSDDENQLIVILDEITDPHNLGAIIRTCETAGACGVIIPKRRSAEVNDTVYKTSAGAISHMKIARVRNIRDTIENLKDKGFWIYGSSGKGRDLYCDLDYSGKVGLVIGNEGKGMTRLVEENCDFLIRIPMYGKINSLNASTSAAIMIYEIVKDFNKNA